MWNLNKSEQEFIEVICSMADTVWLISLQEDRVKIFRDSMDSGLKGKEMAYTVLFETYLKNHIYSRDCEWCRNKMSWNALKEYGRQGGEPITYDLRFIGSQLGFEWHETRLHFLRNEAGEVYRALLISKNENEVRKAKIVGTAVEAEYDFVVYLEAKTNSYIMYTANKQTNTPVPAMISDNFEKEAAEYNLRYMPEEEREGMAEKFKLDHIRAHLEEKGEYVIYASILEEGERRNKMVRFRYFDRERDIWIATRTDITEILDERRQKKLLQDALKAATVANKAKSEFLSRMSHDIRTPMNAIIGMTAIAGAHLDNRERLMDCLEKITSSSRLLLGLINEVLDMSKIESGRIVLAEESLELPDLVQNVVTMVQPQIELKQQNFKIHLNGLNHESVIGDMQRLQQLLLNLLSNAVKYTPDGGHILLEISEKPSAKKNTGCYEFVVSDTGIGMSKEFLKRIFEPFERADDESIKNIQGTGLGMSICRNIVEMMDGSLDVESEYGKGSKFTATLCLRLQEQHMGDESALVDLPVLVVDDDIIVCRNTCGRLKGIGMEAVWTTSGAKAVDMVVSAHNCARDYFAVIVDLKMPGMNGIETTREIRRRVGPDIPIIMISAYDLAQYEDEALKAGANGFIVKPLFTSRLSVCLFLWVE